MQTVAKGGVRVNYRLWGTAAKANPVGHKHYNGSTYQAFSLCIHEQK